MNDRTLKLSQIGPALRLLREIRGEQQNTFATATGTTKAQMSAWERGKQAPTIPSLLKVLNHCDLDFRGLQAAIDALNAIELSREPLIPQEDDKAKIIRKAVEAILEAVEASVETGAST